MEASQHTGRFPRLARSPAVARAALIVSIGSLVASSIGSAGAARTAHPSKPRLGAVVRLGPGGKIPARYLPTVSQAKNARKLSGHTAAQLTGSCAPTTVDLGTWCLMSAPYPLTNDQVGKNDYFFATQACVAQADTSQPPPS